MLPLVTAPFFPARSTCIHESLDPAMQMFLFGHECAMHCECLRTCGFLPFGLGADGMSMETFIERERERESPQLEHGLATPILI